MIRRCLVALGLLGVTLSLLKLFGVITWSWWLVLIPIWLPNLLAGLLIVVGLGFWAYGVLRPRKTPLPSLWREE